MNIEIHKCSVCQGELAGEEKLCPHCGKVFKSEGVLSGDNHENGIPQENPLISWKPKYDLGIKPVDDHHHAIVDIINAMGAALKHGSREKNFNKEIIARLKGYIVEHFAFEERLLKAAGYPDLVDHKKEHHEFIKKVNEMEQDYFNAFFDLRGALDFTVKWFMNHTQKEDRKFVEFITSIKKK